MEHSPIPLKRNTCQHKSMIVTLLITILYHQSPRKKNNWDVNFDVFDGYPHWNPHSRWLTYIKQWTLSDSPIISHKYVNPTPIKSPWYSIVMVTTILSQRYMKNSWVKGYPLIIHFCFGVSTINHLFWGTPMTMETPVWFVYKGTSR